MANDKQKYFFSISQIKK